MSNTNEKIIEVTAGLLDRVNQPLNDPIIVNASGRYMSDFMTDLPHNAYINKGVTGCGGTTLAITNDQPYVIAVHSTNIIVNKTSQHSNICPIYSETTDDDILLYLENPHIQIKKFMVTYDSVPRLLKFINACDYRLLVDESHILIRYLGHFKTSVCHALLSRTYEFKSTSFLTATPTERMYLPEPLKKLDYFEYQWSNIIKPDIKHMYCGSQLQTKVVSFINDRLDNTDDEIYIFYNSKHGVITTIKKLLLIRDDININDINIIFANSNENITFFRQKLKSKNLNIGYKLEVDSNGNPIKGNNRRVNFISSFGFEGIDFYTFGKNATTLVVADAQSKSMRYDIAIDMPQILGRFRRDKDTGLFPKNEIFFIWKTISPEVELKTVEEIFEFIANMIVYGRHINITDEFNSKKARREILQGLNRYAPYVIPNDMTLPIDDIRYIENEYAMEGIMSVYCSTNIDYHTLSNFEDTIDTQLKSNAFIENSLEAISNKLDTFSIQPLSAKHASLLSRSVPFSKIAKEYYELVQSKALIGSDEFENKKQEILEMSDELSEYLEFVSIETMNSHTFRIPKIRPLFEIQKLKHVIKDYGIVEGALIEYDKMLPLIESIYKDHNISDKPKRSIIKNWFNVNDRKIVGGV